MGQVKVTTQIELLDALGTKRKINYVYSNTTVNESNVYYVDVAASSSQIIWDPTNWTGFPVTSFDFLAIISDVEIDIEYTVNEGDSNEELYTKRLVPNLPEYFGADDSYYNHGASDAFGGSLDVIDKIRAQESNGVAAKLTIIMID